MDAVQDYLKQIRELIQANGWEGLLDVEMISQSGQSMIRIRLWKGHLTAPSELVNDYILGIHDLEQIQQECLRALRTGRTGL